MIRHAKIISVMGAVQRAVFRLNEPDKLDAFLCDLGRQHNRNGAKIEYIDVSLLNVPYLFRVDSRACNYIMHISPFPHHLLLSNDSMPDCGHTTLDPYFII